MTPLVPFRRDHMHRKSKLTKHKRRRTSAQRQQPRKRRLEALNQYVGVMALVVGIVFSVAQGVSTFFSSRLSNLLTQLEIFQTYPQLEVRKEGALGHVRLLLVDRNPDSNYKSMHITPMSVIEVKVQDQQGVRYLYVSSQSKPDRNVGSDEITMYDELYSVPESEIMPHQSSYYMSYYLVTFIDSSLGNPPRYKVESPRFHRRGWSVSPATSASLVRC